MTERLETLEIQPSVEKELARYDDEVAFFAEALDGQMSNTYEFIFSGDELYGRDGRSISKILDTALSAAMKISIANPNLSFEYRRRLRELEEYNDLLELAKGESPNTLITISDFPPELMDAKRSVGGYNTERKQTYLRIAYRENNGNLKITSQSLDLSDRIALEQIYSHFGLKAEEGELLGQRIKAEVPIDEQEYLATRLTSIYDQTLASLYGGNWHAGRRPVDLKNTYSFVRAQTDLIDYFLDAKTADPNDAENLRYGLIAALDQRFKRADSPEIFNKILSDYTIREEIYVARSMARVRGLVFAACGVTLGPEQDRDTEDQLKSLGYGNRTKEGSEYKYDLKVYCRICQPNPKPSEPQKMCGPCKICRDCDSKLRSK